MTSTAAVRSQPAAPARKTARTRWYRPFPLLCQLSKTMAKCTPIPMARLEWVSMSRRNRLTTCSIMLFVILRLEMCPFCLPATCEMCGMVGVRDAFYSKTKRFCSVSCSRSYSSNSKKASILARLQVSALKSQPKRSGTSLYKQYFLNICICFFFPRENHQQKRQKSYRNSPLWQSWLPTPNTKQVNRTRQNQKLVRQPIGEVVK